MDIKQAEKLKIETKLNEEFAKSGRRLVFWYDEDGKFESMLPELTINAKIYRMEEATTFATKYMLEVEDKDSNYLIYANYEKPLNEDNHLTDIILYSGLFNPDPMQMFIGELRMPDRYVYLMKKNKKVFDSAERRQRFIDLQIEHYDEERIELGILCVLCKAKSVNFDEIVKCVLMDDIENSKHIAEFARFNMESTFWKYAEKYYGYRADHKDLESLVTCLLITYTEQQIIGGSLGSSFKQYLCDKQANVVPFVSNFMNNMLCENRYNELAAMVAKRVNIATAISKMDIMRFEACDAFEDFDKEIIKRCIKELITNHNMISFHSFENNRLNLHFGRKYVHEYKCVLHSYNMLKIIEDYKSPASAGEAIAIYKSKYFGVDRNYRKFYLHYDALEDNSGFEILKSKVENSYTNDYLRKSTVDWSKMMPNALLGTDANINRQQRFYDKYVKTFKDRLIVIISDAFRYECATELIDRFKDSMYDTTLEYMLSSVPSYTQLGMALLLPHSTVALDSDNDYNVLIDGASCGNMLSRNKILCNYNADSLAISYNDIIAMKKADLRSTFAGKNVIYIFHDQVDAIGDKTATENEVFNACSVAINEIAGLIKKLTGNISSTNYIITADHGFIYKRDKIEESDKVLLASGGKILLNKRFILSQGNLDIDGAKCLSMGYILGKESATCVTVPVGSDIFKAKGGGQNYVHGGGSLQEMLVPIVRVHTQKTMVEPNSVEISLLSLSRKITNLITYIEFIQIQKIGDEIKSASFRIVFENDKGETITNEEILVADKKDEKPENRIFKKKFTFKDMKYKITNKYYMVIRDDKTGDEVSRMEFMIDIIFAGGFGF